MYDWKTHYTTIIIPKDEPRDPDALPKYIAERMNYVEEFTARINHVKQHVTDHMMEFLAGEPCTCGWVYDERDDDWDDV